MLYNAVVFLPLLGSVIAGLFGRLIGDRASQIVTCVLLGVSAALAVPIFINVALHHHDVTVPLMGWIHSGDLDIRWSVRFDTLTAVMTVVVTWVSFVVHVYSIGYMAHDKSIPRFMSFLSLFTFAMMALVTADNLVQLFFGWEGVGLASYLLIGFWYDRPAACAAAIKAFVVNRIGDFGFALGIFATYVLFGSVSFQTIFAAVPAKADAVMHVFGGDWHALTVICLLLFMGAMGKSAQIGLHTWLPDAMEGPTPVSALIHAATMVTAGVFMVARMSPLFEYSSTALTVVTVIGAVTAFFAATVACVQTDIKKVIAYSTCSQLGYMFCAIGVSAYPAAIFHLFTHAFFKALLFLAAGSVIHAMSDEQDIRRMGGIWRHVKATWMLMWIGCLALAGIPPFAGHYSKDAILSSAWASHTAVGQFAFVMGVAAAFLTAFYSWRMLILVFHGKPRADEHVMAHVHESPVVMILPMLVLGLGSIFAGWLGAPDFVGAGEAAFWGKALLILPNHGALVGRTGVPAWVEMAPLVVALSGVVLAYVFYSFVPSLPGKLATVARGPYLFLVNKWYFDALYDRLFVRPAFRLGRSLWLGGDGAVIDTVGPDGVAAAARDIARRVAAWQSGYLYHYAFAMLVGVAVFVSWYVFNVR